MVSLRMRLVLIEWLDSYGGSGGWKALDDLAPDELLCRSVGWLLHDTATVKVLVPHVVQPDEDTRIAAQGRGEMAIPCASIVNIRDLIDPLTPSSDATSVLANGDVVLRGGGHIIATIQVPESPQ